MHYPNPYSQYPINRAYSPTDISIFEHSVAAFQNTVAEASTILRRLAEPHFASRLMAAAQTGNQHEVDRLIGSIGTRSPVTTQYTPTGILLTIHAHAQGSQCCTLTMYLKWGH